MGGGTGDGGRRPRPPCSYWQVPCLQERPLTHALPVGQHGSPSPPHTKQVVVAKQAPEPPTARSQQLPAWHTLFAQQVCPLAPHAVHVPLTHVSPLEQAPSGATHVPFGSQQPPLAHVLPAQHT